MTDFHHDVLVIGSTGVVMAAGTSSQEREGIFDRADVLARDYLSLNNWKARVLDPHWRPIHGLYTAGGVIGKHYVGRGNSYANALVLGRRAGKGAVAADLTAAATVPGTSEEQPA